MIEQSRPIWSNIKLDVLIPVHTKDLVTLPYVVDFLRRNIKHPIGEIMIISAKHDSIKRICDKKACRFVDENQVLPIAKEDFHYVGSWKGKRVDRSGWILQQLIKLSGDTLSKQTHYLTIDADTLLIRPHIFLEDNKTIFYYGSQKQKYLEEYYRTINKLLGGNVVPPISQSFITHYMCFERSKVAELKKTIESHTKKYWYNAVIESINKRKLITFSEFETYGVFVSQNYPGQLLLKPSLNIGKRRKEIHNVYKLNLPELAQKYRSISYHRHFR
ncbi:DUF6492 family protein [Ammoniphilus sp. CFH 90114]|uniref:DUF6492 family protein n=1 Tax=Ammoniphilus sp. CFH 90114 TaxID=2493665 RepID=UPI00100FC14C|nr:DUF6492 family protein [Ammoniphilus sp. CFH 90114]RXT13991.1 hypothetical protein EIZ39_07605 [Ammoniphilus sp. CFH 90114]